MQLPKVRWVGQASLGPLPSSPLHLLPLSSSAVKPRTHTFSTDLVCLHTAGAPTVHLCPSVRLSVLALEARGKERKACTACPPACLPVCLPGHLRIRYDVGNGRYICLSSSPQVPICLWNGITPGLSVLACTGTYLSTFYLTSTYLGSGHAFISSFTLLTMAAAWVGTYNSTRVR
ncbi:hypothetical protein LZ31DRAFT_324331 [Colletotrichum somersetense]|nr:hypothetical protein LZ31DRAFT_324331 [Colletotrichum somersetense]